MNPLSCPISWTQLIFIIPYKQLKGYNSETMHNTRITLRSQVGGKARQLQEDSLLRSSVPRWQGLFHPLGCEQPQGERDQDTISQGTSTGFTTWVAMIHKHWDNVGANHTGKHEDLKRKIKLKLNFCFAICLSPYPGVKSALKGDDFKAPSVDSSPDWVVRARWQPCIIPRPLLLCLKFQILRWLQIHWR